MSYQAYLGTIIILGNILSLMSLCMIHWHILKKFELNCCVSRCGWSHEYGGHTKTYLKRRHGNCSARMLGPEQKTSAADCW